MAAALTAVALACAAPAGSSEIGRDPAEGPSRLVLGGLGTGTLEWRADGVFANAALMRNRGFAVADLPGTFMAIWVSRGDRTEARVLAERSAYALPCLPKARVAPRFPVGTLECRDGSLPVEVTVRAWSPVVPQDTVASSLTLIMLSADVRNTGEQPATVSVALSWESTLGVGGAPSLGPFANRTGVVAQAIAPQERTTGIAFDGPPIVDSPAGDMRRHNSRGAQVIMTEYPSTSAGVTGAAWNVLDRVPAWWDGFAANGEVSGGECVGDEGRVHPAGCVATKVALAAGESREYAFAIAWRQDRFYDADGKSWVQPSARMFVDAASVARYGLANRQALLTLSTEWQSRVERSTGGADRIAAMCDELADAVHAVDVRAEEDAPRARQVRVDHGSPATDRPPARANVPLLLSFPLCNAEDLKRRAEEVSTEAPLDGLAAAVLAHAWFAGERTWVSEIWPLLRPPIASIPQGSGGQSVAADDLRAMADLAALANDTDLTAKLRRLGAGRPLDDAELLGESSWAGWLVWAGCNHNRLTNSLAFDVGGSDAGTSRHAAVFHPAFWGWTEWRRTTTGAEFMLRVDRTMGPPRGSALPMTVEGLAGAPGIGVQSVHLRIARIPRAVSVTAIHGVTPVPCRVDVDEGYGATLTPEGPLQLRTGDRFTVTVVWTPPRGR